MVIPTRMYHPPYTSTRLAALAAALAMATARQCWSSVLAFGSTNVTTQQQVTSLAAAAIWPPATTTYPASRSLSTVQHT